MTWREQAACLGADLGTFFVGLGQRGQGRISNAAKTRALALCAGCPVRAECLEYAVTTYQDDGIWGGMTASQRIRLRRKGRGGSVNTPTAPLQNFCILQEAVKV